MRTKNIPLIRNIYSNSYEEDIFVTSEFESSLCVWSLKTKSQLSTFTTNFDFGGRRVCVVPLHNKPILISGAYHVHGITAHDVLSGKVLWCRRDLKKLQEINYIYGSSGEYIVWASFADKSMHILNPETGDTIRKIHGSKALFQSPDHEFILHIGNSTCNLYGSMGRDLVSKIQNQTFAPLGVTFSNDGFAISWSGGSIEYYDFEGLKKWDFRQKKNSHFLNIAWNAENNILAGIEWNYLNGGRKTLVQIDQTGVELKRDTLGDIFEHEFMSNGSVLITSVGTAYSIPALEPVWDFWSMDTEL